MSVFDKNSKILVTGASGMVGSALVRALELAGFSNLFAPSHAELDLTNQSAVLSFFKREKPEYVFMAAAKVGGIYANNTYPADFIYDNILIEANTIHAAYLNGVKRLMFLGSTCIYPKLAEQPLSEASLLSGAIEPTNEPYAIAKIAGIKLCESYNRQYACDFRSILPTNLFGQRDNFHPKNSHVIPAMMRRFHEARLSGVPSVNIWGSGRAMREFMHVDDMAQACIFLMSIDSVKYQSKVSSMQSHVNVGTGKDITIRELAETMKSVVGYQGNLVFDSSKPEGAPRKLCDVSLMNSLGLSIECDLEEGLKQTYAWFLDNSLNLRSE